MSKIFRYKLAVLIHGKETDKPKVNAMIMLLQVQLNELSKNYEVDGIEATFYLNNDKDDLKRKKWCLAHTTGTHYVELTTPFKIQQNYLKKLWFWLENNEDNETKLAKKEIYKRKSWQVNIDNPAYQEEFEPYDGVEDIEHKDVTNN